MVILYKKRLPKKIIQTMGRISECGYINNHVHTVIPTKVDVVHIWGDHVP